MLASTLIGAFGWYVGIGVINESVVRSHGLPGFVLGAVILAVGVGATVYFLYHLKPEVEAGLTELGRLLGR